MKDDKKKFDDTIDEELDENEVDEETEEVDEEVDEELDEEAEEVQPVQEQKAEKTDNKKSVGTYIKNYCKKKNLYAAVFSIILTLAAFISTLVMCLPKNSNEMDYYSSFTYLNLGGFNKLTDILTRNGKTDKNSNNEEVKYLSKEIIDENSYSELSLNMVTNKREATVVFMTLLDNGGSLLTTFDLPARANTTVMSAFSLSSVADGFLFEGSFNASAFTYNSTVTVDYYYSDYIAQSNATSLVSLAVVEALNYMSELLEDYNLELWELGFTRFVASHN